jgi:iron complex outermembrane recepter protein
MKREGKCQLLRASLLSGAAVTVNALVAQIASAQATNPPSAIRSAAAGTEALEEVVVTGSNAAQKILDTSYAVTAVDQEALKNSPAIGLAALLSNVPGLYGEASGGEENLNISPRGVRGGFLEYISLQEDGLPIIYNGFLEELEVRRDLTDDRMEVTRGGPSGVLTSNGAGAIVNFISRKAGDTPGGEASVSYSDYRSVRTDFFYGTPIGTSGQTSATFGGYWRGGDGVKDVGYQANRGGQFKGAITHSFDHGALTVSYKHIDDHTQFYLPQPVKITQDGGVQRISPIPGFNARSDYLAGPQTQSINVKTPNGSSQNINLGDGIWEKSDTLTLHGSYDWQNGFRWKDSLRFAKINMVDNDLRNLGGNNQIYSAGSFLASDPRVSNLIATFAPQGAVGARLVRVDTGTPVTNAATMNGNGLLVEMGANQYTQSMDTVINDAQLTFDGYNNNATVGLLSWNVNMNVSQIAVDYLLDVTNQAHLIDVAAVNAAGQTVGHLTDNGVMQYDDSYGNGTVHINSNSVYFNDQYHPIDPLRLDGGVRYERVNYGSTSENVVSNPPLAGVVSSNVVADATGSGYGNGTFTSGKSTLTGTAWTFGANYELTDHLAVYGRYASAFDTGIANFAVFSPGSSGLPNKLTRLRFGELGVRFASTTFFTELTGFRSVNKNIGEAVSNTGAQIFLDNTATGVEFDAKYRPLPVLTFDLSGVGQRSELTAVGGSTSFDGNQIDRLPNFQAHFTPTLSLPSGRASAYVTVSYYGKRWGDLANTLQLDAYTDLAAGVSVKLNDSMTVAVQGTNLTNKFSITEGNPRGNAVIAGTNSYGFARANLPRVFMISLNAKF